MCAAIYRSNFWQRLKLFSSSQFAQLQTCITHFSILDPIAPLWSMKILNEKKKMLHFHWIAVRRREFTWQVDLAELNLHTDQSTTSTLSPQLIFLISQSFLDNCQLLIGVWSSWKVTCRFCRPRRKQVGSCLGNSWDRRGHGNWENISSSSRKRSTPTHCQELTQELLAKNIKREPYSLSPNGC